MVEESEPRMVESSPRRVVITGMGLVCPLGCTASSLWDSLRAGRSGVGPLTQIPTDTLPIRHGAEAREFTGDISEFGPLDKTMQRNIRKGLKVMCREIQMGVAAAQLALVDAGLDPSKRNPERTGVTFGSDYIMTDPGEYTDGIRACLDENGKFQWSRWPEQGLPKVDPLWLLKYLPNMPASHVAIYNDLRGPSNSITLREASGNLTLGEAFTTILRGSADAIVAGATGSRIHSIRTVHVLLQEEVTRADLPPERLSRPFDRDRTGMVLGEGAGVFVLEELSHAQARGARILAEVVGQGSAAVAGKDGTANCEKALAIAARNAIADARMTPNAIGHVHAHGLSTRAMDAAEARALRTVFGDRAASVPVVAAKGHFGNLGAASGMIELMASVQALNAGSLFATLNYDTPDPECPLAVVTSPDTPAGDSVLNLSVTPLGQAGAIVVKKFVA